MTFDFGGVTVTTWSVDDCGQQQWRVRSSTFGLRVATFTAPRDADPAWLSAISMVLLGLPLGPNTLDVLEAHVGHGV